MILHSVNFQKHRICIDSQYNSYMLFYSFERRFPTFRRRQRRGRRRLINEPIFYLRISRYSSFSLFLTVKTFSKMNMGHSVKKTVVVHLFQTTQSLVILRCCFPENAE